MRYVEKEKIIYKDKIIKVPAADISKPCPIDEFTRVRRDVFGALPESSSKVQTKCRAWIPEPYEPEKKDLVIRENAKTFGDCAGKVVILLEEVKQLKK